jgi:hypothetical protein
MVSAIVITSEDCELYECMIQPTMQLKMYKKNLDVKRSEGSSLSKAMHIDNISYKFFSAKNSIHLYEEKELGM